MCLYKTFMNNMIDSIRDRENSGDVDREKNEIVTELLEFRLNPPN